MNRALTVSKPASHLHIKSNEIMCVYDFTHVHNNKKGNHRLWMLFINHFNPIYFSRVYHLILQRLQSMHIVLECTTMLSSIRHTLFSHRTPICAWSFVHTKYIETPLFRGGHTLPKAVEVIRKYSFYGFLTRSLWIFYTRNLLSL